MPLSNTARLIFNGHLPNGEVFATGFWVNIVDPPASQTAWQSQISTMDDIVGDDLVALSGSLLSAGSGFDELVAYYYAGGSGAQYIGRVATPVDGVGDTHMPNQVALVATLLTNNPTAKGRGRMYLPCPKLTVQAATGQLTQPQVAAISELVVNLLEDVNVGLGNAVVYSPTGAQINIVTAVRMDTRLDIQRRRADREVVVGSATEPVTAA